MIFPAKKSHPLQSIANELRNDILDMVYQSGSGHIGGSLSSLDTIIALYFSDIFNFDHDHFILSSGHTCLAHYAVLAKLGKINKDILTSIGELDSIIQGHESIDVPGVEFSSGLLGQGLSFSCGVALGDSNHHTICLTSDGEHNEGQVWEALMFANKYHLGNLINIVDYNGLQIDGSTSDIMPLGELAAKYIRFGWTVTTVDGHNFPELIKAIKKAKNSTIYPACIIAKTTLGKGFASMENDYHYHDVKDMTSDSYHQFKQELKL